MLSGLTDTSSSMFGTICGMQKPTVGDMSKAYEDAQHDRHVTLSGYYTEIYDMGSAKGRKAYNDLMFSLSSKLQLREAVVRVHERKVMQRSDGSTGWFNYVEWAEVKLEDRGVVVAGGKKASKVRRSK